MRQTGNHGVGEQVIGFLSLIIFALVGLGALYWIGYGLSYARRFLK